MSDAHSTSRAEDAAQLRWLIISTLDACGMIGANLEVIQVPLRAARPGVTLEDVRRELAFLRDAGLVKTELGGGRVAAILTNAGRSFAAYDIEDIEGIERPRSPGAVQ